MCWFGMHPKVFLVRWFLLWIFLIIKIRCETRLQWGEDIRIGIGKHARSLVDMLICFGMADFLQQHIDVNISASKEIDMNFSAMSYVRVIHFIQDRCLEYYQLNSPFILQKSRSKTSLFTMIISQPIKTARNFLGRHGVFPGPYPHPMWDRNLDHRPERWDFMQRQFQQLRLPVERFSAVNGRQLDVPELAMIHGPMVGVAGGVGG